MSDADRKGRVEELKRLVQSGEYQVDAREVAASIIRKSEKPERKPSPKAKKASV